MQPAGGHGITEPGPKLSLMYSMQHLSARCSTPTVECIGLKPLAWALTMKSFRA